jgi:hypothetical protein
MVIKHKVIISTPRFLRKPKIEEFMGLWNNEQEIRTLLLKYRPKSNLIYIERVYPDNEIILWL